MKVEVRCRNCDGGYLVEAEVIEAGLPCPGCGRELRDDGSQPSVVAEHREVQAPGAVTAPATVVATGASAVATVDEIVCPRCSLHFKPRAETQARARSAAPRPTVLVVEDMTYFREIAGEALDGEYEVKTASTKGEGLAILGQGGIDLMILDLTLDGGEGGLDLLRELKAKPCPVLIYTARDESEMYGDSWDELQSFGADDIVIKGMNVGDELIRKVGELLGRETPDDE